MIVSDRVDARERARRLLREEVCARIAASDAYFTAAAEAMARCAVAMADRFFDGATLLVLGSGTAVTDAQHNAVEYLHPALPGCRALPALAIGATATCAALEQATDPDAHLAAQVEALGSRSDVVLAITAEPVPSAVVRALAAAGRRGMLTVALVAGTPGSEVLGDHVLTPPGGDPLIAQELQLATYHVLWELVHIALNHRGIATVAGSGAEAGGDAFSQLLYPMLSSRSGSAGDLLDALSVAPAEKSAESNRLRGEVLEVQGERLLDCAETLAAAGGRGGRLLVCGNGGSATTASDLCADLMSATPTAAVIPAVCLTDDVAVVTALANDIGVDAVFARQVEALGRPGDVVVAISTSGSSENLVRALDAGRRCGLVTVALSGYDGGRMVAEARPDHAVVVPSSSVHRIQEVQTTVCHLLVELVRHHLEVGACA